MGVLIRGMIDEKWRRNARRDAARLGAQPVPPGVEALEGLPYLPDGHPMHTLNLYRPAGASGPLPTVVDLLARSGRDRDYGARPLRRAIAAQVEDPAADLMLEGCLRRGDTLQVTEKEGRLQVRPGPQGPPPAAE